jgi:hypothetical protein
MVPASLTLVVLVYSYAVFTRVSVECVCLSRRCYTTNMCLHSEVVSGKSGLKRNRARSTESHASEEPLTRETLLAVTAPTIKSCCSVSLEGSKPCSADVSVNSPHVRPTRAGDNTLKLTYQPTSAKYGQINGLVGKRKPIIPVTYLSVGVAVTNERRVVRRVQCTNYCYSDHHNERLMTRTSHLHNQNIPRNISSRVRRCSLP